MRRGPLGPKVLVLRPGPAALRTAAALRRAGHEPVLAPLLTLLPTSQGPLVQPAPDRPYAAVIAASPNAITLLDDESRARLAGMPALVVGARTKEAAQAAGLRVAEPVFRTARELARGLGGAAPKSRILYLAGQDRRPEIEEALRQGGYDFVLAEVYRTAVAADLPHAAEAALRGPGLAAVLHYSARSAAAYLDLAAKAGLLREALAPMQLCLSAAVAKPLLAAGASRVRAAPAPDELHLLALLNEKLDI